MRTLALAALALTMLGFTAAPASASDYHQPRYYWKTVTIVETVRVPVVHWVVRYDHCGEPYRAKVVTYKLVNVPVEKQVKVAF